MRVSIIIPVYKVEKHIRKCLQSVLKQDYPNIEVIVVDDCSPDSSIEIAKEIINAYDTTSRIVTHEQNRGLSAARNSGIDASTGDAIYFIDSDDELYDKSVISHLVQKMQCTGADIVAGNYQWVYNDNGRIVSTRYIQEKIFTGKNEIINSFCNGDIPITAWNKLIKKEFITRNSLFFKEGILHEDELWTFNTALTATRIVLTGMTTYNYYIQENSIMSKKDIRHLHSLIEVYREMSISSSVNEGLMQKVSSHLNRFAFQRYLEIMQIKLPLPTKKELYSKLRDCQKGIKTYMTLKYFVMHIHLLFPAPIGFHIMSMTAKLHSWAKQLK